MSIKLLLQLLGGVGLLIYGIKIMGEALQNLAGEKLRRLIAQLTFTPARGVAVGTAVTMILQSSSATTLMVVSFVNVGLMSLYQAFGVIMGANVGTTMTAQLMAFKITDYAMIAVVIGTVLSIMGKSRRQKQIGTCLVGFGLLFVGLDFMSDSMKFLRGRQDLFLPFRHNPLLGVLAGTIVTMLVQSSSATVGLTITMAAQGVVPVDVAIAMICGDNIGTTITAVIASLGCNRAAKQAALCHVMFNVFGTLVILPFLPLFTELVKMTSGDIARQVANAHTIFNVGNTLLFLPFAAPFVKLIQRIIPAEDVYSTRGARYLDKNLIAASPVAALNAIKSEMVRMCGITLKMMEQCKRALIDGDSKAVEEVTQNEKIVNGLNHDIVKYGTELGQKKLSIEASTILNTFLGGVGDIERIGDHCTNLIEMYEFMQDNKLKFTEDAIEQFSQYYNLVYSAVEKTSLALDTEDMALAKEVLMLEDKIDDMEKDLRLKNIERLSKGDCNSGAGIVFIDILSNLERVGDHAHNVAYIAIDLVKINRGEQIKRGEAKNG